VSPNSHFDNSSLQDLEKQKKSAAIEVLPARAYFRTMTSGSFPAAFSKVAILHPESV